MPVTESTVFEGSEPLELITAVDVAYHGIRMSILNGEFGPGMQLKLQNLGDRYSMSLIPVREALRLLQAEGLVESVRNKGARVASISLDETIDVYRLRLVLETTALKLAFPHIDNELIATLEDMQQEMRRIFAADRARYLALHQKLHHIPFESLRHHIPAVLGANLHDVARLREALGGVQRRVRDASLYLPRMLFFGSGICLLGLPLHI